MDINTYVPLKNNIFTIFSCMLIVLLFLYCWLRFEEIGVIFTKSEVLAIKTLPDMSSFVINDESDGIQLWTFNDVEKQSSLTIEEQKKKGIMTFSFSFISHYNVYGIILTII